MEFAQPEADVFVPDGSDPVQALRRVTHLCLGAHQDDIEIMAQAGITECRGHAERAFGGVVLTDGGGAPRAGRFAGLSDRELQEVRKQEQRAAARLGGYAIQIQLAHPSMVLKGTSPLRVERDLAAILGACRPRVVYLHNPADKHDTHVAAFACCLRALRARPAAERPPLVFGCEVWRDLDWLPDDAKVGLDAGRDPQLAEALLRTFASQIEGGKHYDRATLGRRAANATYYASHAVDGLTAVTWAVDLTRLVHDETLDPVAFALDLVDAFRVDVEERLRRFVR